MIVATPFLAVKLVEPSIVTVPLQNSTTELLPLMYVPSNVISVRVRFA